MVILLPFSTKPLSRPFARADLSNCGIALLQLLRHMFTGEVELLNLLKRI
jgi:hypothetical protein